jgi:mitochondrial import inner membrane translocase subunit TIM50
VEEKVQFNEFKTHRKILFMLGKLLKWTCWAAFAMYVYHLYLVIKKDKPEQAFLANEMFLHAAGFTKYNYDMLTILLTRPPVDRLLLERPPLPAGYQHPKVLVLNLNGTLIHSEYKFGVGFEVLKRPGLTMFLNTMARNFEVVVFGD